MSNKIMIGRYYSIKSRVHSMNPLAKIICTLLFMVTIFMTYDVKLNIVILFLMMLVLFDTKIPLKIFLKLIYDLKWLLLIILIINLVLNVSIVVNIICILRLIYIVLYTSVLTLTTPPTEITYGLERLLSPLKIIGIRVNKVALFISSALGFIPNIVDQKNKILKSQASRGIDYYNCNLKGKRIVLQALLEPLLTLTVKRTKRLYVSMDLRLYNINKTRVNFRQNKWRFYDTFMVVIHVSLFILIVKEVML